MPTTKTQYFGQVDWKMVPPHLKRKWWEETDYSNKEPSPELLAELKAAIEEVKNKGN